MSSNEEEQRDMKELDRLYDTVKEAKEYKAIRYVLEPLIENAKSSKEAKDFLRIQAPRLRKRFENNKRLMRLFREDSKLHNGDIVTLRKAFVYLGLFETSLTNILDLILMFFVSSHHDVFNYLRKKYVRSLDDLDRISLFEKLIFLEQHDLKLFSDNVNRTLRNKIAHMEFEIEEDGGISIDNKRIRLEDEIYSLMAFLLCVTHALDDSGVSTIMAELSQTD